MYKEIINLYISENYVFFFNILSYKFNELLIYPIDLKLRPVKKYYLINMWVLNYQGYNICII